MGRVEQHVDLSFLLPKFVVCGSAEVAVFVGWDSYSYLSLFCLKAFPLCTTPAWQCSCVIIDKTTVSGKKCQGLSIVFEMDSIPPIWVENSCQSLVTQGYTERHNLPQASRWCQEMFYANTAMPSVWEALLLCHSNWEAQTDLDMLLYLPGRHTLLLCFWKLWVRLEGHKMWLPPLGAKHVPRQRIPLSFPSFFGREGYVINWQVQIVAEVSWFGFSYFGSRA